MQFLETFVEKVLDYTLKPVVRQFGYVIFYNKNMEELKQQAENLKAKRTNVEHLVDAARDTQVISRVVELWQGRVDGIMKETEEFFKDERHANAGCSQNSCPNLWSRYKLSRKAKKTASEVGDLNGQGNFDELAIGPKPVDFIGHSSVVKEAFESRAATMNEVMKALADPDLHAIGIYGLGGVGKTTLAKQVAGEARDKKLFDTVLFVEVKQNYFIEEIQSRIASMLGFQFDSDTEQHRRTDKLRQKLKQKLEQEKSLLIVLDDLWERPDFEQIGIPFVDEANRQCRFIFTSRSKRLLSTQMKCERNIKVELLSKDEAWELFKKMAKINDDSDDSVLVRKAHDISQKCARLPVAIVAVASALRNNKSLAEWKDALRRLNNYSSQDIPEMEKVYSSIKWSYDFLKRKELQSTFKLSAMLTRDPFIEELFMYAIGLGFLKGIDNMEAARDRVVALVSELKGSSLLLDSYSKDRFTIHDVVRDVALSVAFKEDYALVKNRHENVAEWPNKNQLERWTAICLDECDIDELPEGLYGPEVEFFYLKSKDPKLNIPSSFFDGMQEVKVLSLSNMTFSSLPPSISLLKKLTTLSLHSCTLEDITVVEHLKELKILNLSQSGIKQLPCEVGQLSRLKILNLSHCYQLKVIPPHILSNLKKLEELYMGGSFDRWEAEGLNEGKEKASLDELKHLQKLSALEIHIPDASVLPKDLFLKNSLERYKISIGSYDRYYGREFSRVLTLRVDDNVNMEYGIFKLFESVDNLTLENLNGIASLYQSQITTQIFCNLRAIKVEFCDQLEYLFSVSTTRTLVAKLETIEVSSCKSLEEIVAFVDEENVEKGSTTNVIELRQLRSLALNNLPVLTDFCFSNQVTFPNLETLILASCDQWKSLFLASMAGTLSRLESIEVRNCKCLEEIVASTNDENVEKGSAMDVIEFLELRYLELNDLPELIGFCLNNKVTFPNLETLILASFNCPNIWDLFTSKSSGTQNHVTPQTFCKLETIKVSSCDQLKSLFLVSMAGILSRLESIEVRNCKSLEEIVAFEDNENENVIEFLQLRFLELNDLPALTDFCFSNKVAFPKLETLSLASVNCHDIWHIPASRGSRAQIVEIVESSQIGAVFNDSLPDRSFSNLKTLTVEKCDFLLKLIPLHILKSLSNLEELEISDCDSLEVVFDLGELNNYKETHTFRLKTLLLRDLPKLEAVWSKGLRGIVSFQSLEKLDIRNCYKLEIFQAVDEKVAFPKLETLILESVNCHDVWHIPTSTGNQTRIMESSQMGAVFNDSLANRSFINLKSLKVEKCDFLLKLIPLHILKSLSNLEELEISHCALLEVMFDFGEFNTYKETHTFRLKTLLLSDLPKLKGIWNRGLQGLVSFQCLQKLEIRDCDKLEIFQAVDEKVFPKLEELDLWGRQAKMVWNGEFRTYHFSTVKVLSLLGIYQKAATFPYGLLCGFPKLEKLRVGHCSFLVIISCPKGPLDNDVRKVTSIKSLRLSSMDELKHIWDGKCQLDHILQNLEVLEVSFCYRLTNLGPSFVSLENLTELDVDYCDEMINLLTSSTAKTLVQLTSLKIKSCKKMEEIITNGEEDVENEIVFVKLKKLKLDQLPSCKSFCCHNHTFNFPLLDKVTIKGCPKFRTFCPGIVTTKLLKGVKVENGKIHWHNNLDNTIQQLFDDKGSLFAALKNLEVKNDEYPELIELIDVWNGKLASGGYFTNLRSLVMDNCSFLSNHVIPSYILTSFVNLERLQVRNCDSVEVVFDLEGLDIDKEARKLQALPLMSLTIEHLPNLKYVWNKDPHTIHCFQHLWWMRANECESLRSIFPSSIAKGLINLRSLRIGSCGIEVIVAENQTPTSSIHFVFPELWCLDLVKLPNLKNFHPQRHTVEWPKLRNMNVRQCKKVKVFSWEKPEITEKEAEDGVDNDQYPFFLFEKVAFPELETLSLTSVNCHNIWHIPTSRGNRTQIVEIVESSQIGAVFNDSLPNRSFSNLKTLTVEKCDFLLKLIPLHILKSLSNLEVLEIKDCASLEVVFDFGEPTNYKETYTFRLKTLLLNDLPKLEAVWSRGFQGIVSFQSLQELDIRNCYKLEIFQAVDEKVFPELEELILTGREAKMMWNGEFRAYHFSTVKVLSLSRIYDRAATFSYGLLYGFPKLEELKVKRCSSLVIFSSKKRPLDNDVQKVTSIKSLELSSMNKLKHIWDGKCQLDHILQYLKVLQVSSCDELINLGPSFVSLENLTKLDVSYCNEMINLLTSSTAKTLVQLTSLEITSCKKMEEIITNGEEDVENEIAFVKLKKLTLDELPSCKSFCCHNHTINFPLLNEVTIKGCPRFRIFCPGVITTPLLKEVEVEGEEIHSQNNLNNTIQQLFNDKGSLFAALMNLDVKNDEYPELIDVWNGKLASGRYFTNLTSLVMDNCSFLSNHVIPSYILTSFVNLERLEVRNCESVEVLFDLEGLDIDKEAHTLQAIPLWDLRIEHLPNLKYVWNKDPHTIHCFQRLWRMHANECEKLRSIFPSSIAKGLTKLESLTIESCGIEVIVAENQTPTTSIHFVFPELCRLHLIKLPNLKNFYPQRHAVEWPKLQNMNVRQCKKVKVFSWEEPEITEKEAEDGVENDQYPLLCEKVVPQLRSLVLNQYHVKMIRNGQIQEDIFNNVDSLTLDSFYEDETLEFPYTFIERFPKLESLEVSHSCFKSIFPCEGHLVPSSAAFDNLQRLNVSGCHCLGYLLTTLTAKSLVHLKSLAIEDCKIMEEIVTNKGEDVEDKIVFRKLKYMKLVDLPDLKSFSSQICTFEFPSLTDVTIRGCSEMKMFCPKVLVTPLLEDMKIEENEERWEGDLNKTVEKLFLEKEGEDSLKS